MLFIAACRLLMTSKDALTVFVNMRRLLRRSLGNTGCEKSGNRGARRERSKSVGASGQADGGGAVAEMESLPVPEPQRGHDVDDVEEQMKIFDWPEKSQRSQPQRFDQLSDSGCDMEMSATSGFRLRRWGVLERQNALTSSATSSVVSPSSSTLFVRFRRQRASLRSFRVRSEQFLRRRMVPSCLRRAGDNDDAYGPARRTRSDVGVTAVGGWLTAPRTVYGIDGVEYVLPENTMAPSRTRHSSISDITTTLSSVDVPAWNDYGSSLESTTSAHCISHLQVCQF